VSFPAPSLTPPALADYQWSLNGLAMGANTPFGVLTAEGFDLAAIRSGDTPWPRDHGEAMGLDVYGGRDPLLDVWMKTDGVSLQQAQLELAAATTVRPNEEVPCWFQLPNLPLLCVMCRPRKRPVKIDSDYAAGNIAKPELSLHATDPRIYGAGQAETLTLATPKGGLPFPVGFPVTFSTTTPSTVVVENGNTEMRPIAVFSGPLTNPTIENVSIASEPFLKLVNPEETGYTVLAGDQILLDLGTPHLIQYYTGGVSAGNEPQDISGWLTTTSTWWDLLPGSNTVRFYTNDATNTGGTCEFQWAPAYML
jgi:hypothetical protein